MRVRSALEVLRKAGRRGSTANVQQPVAQMPGRRSDVVLYLEARPPAAMDRSDSKEPGSVNCSLTHII
jgi:hypothetical protein